MAEAWEFKEVDELEAGKKGRLHPMAYASWSAEEGIEGRLREIGSPRRFEHGRSEISHSVEE